MLDRRTFLKIIAGTSVGYLLRPSGLKSWSSPEDEKITFAVVKSADPAIAVRKAVGLLGGINSFISKGDRVFIKPNMSWDRVPEQAATTNPTVVRAAVKLAFQAGAKKVIVADNTCNDARRTYKHSGIRAAASEAGAEVPFMEERKFVKTTMNGEAIKEWEVYKEVLEADKIINIPIAKHHGLSGVTLSMKNLMGLIGGRRNLLHQKLSQSIVDLASFFRPQLTILDAIRVLTDHGPQGGSISDIKKMDLVAASTDMVRIDSFGISLFGDKYSNSTIDWFPHLKMASERGLGRINYSQKGFKKLEI
jgi:uncharacterized protein (DUF362 family)